MGIIAQVYRGSHGYDCSNDGISSKAADLLIINAEGPFIEMPVSPRWPMVKGMMVKGNLPGCVKIVPVDDDTGEPVSSWVMFGGNFAYSSDSRFGELVERLGGPRHGGAVPIHDRIEG